jgi:magnesium-transporting ATPase (P-type)
MGIYWICRTISEGCVNGCNERDAEDIVHRLSREDSHHYLLRKLQFPAIKDEFEKKILENYLKEFGYNNIHILNNINEFRSNVDIDKNNILFIDDKFTDYASNDVANAIKEQIKDINISIIGYNANGDKIENENENSKQNHSNLLKAGWYNSRATVEDNKIVGDPTELALVVAAKNRLFLR